MIYTATLIKDIGGIPIPQGLNNSLTPPAYEPLQSTNGALHILLYDQNGNPLLTASNPGIVTVSGTPTSGYSTAKAGITTITVAGTPISLGSQALGSGVTIIANPGNTGNVYVFPAGGIKTAVIPLKPGDSISWPVANLSALIIDADTNGNSIFWQGAV